VNVETGRSTSYSFSKPYKYENAIGNPECPSTLEALSKAFDQAASALADNLSPAIVTVKIPLASDADDLIDEKKGAVEKSLEEGNKWAQAGDFDMAAQIWEKALDASGGSSAAALWNLAAYKWYAGDMDSAEKYFKKAFLSGGAEWVNARRRRVWGEFQREKEYRADEVPNR